MTSFDMLNRIDIETTLTVLTALHIGDGSICRLNAYPEISANVSATQRGGESVLPYIPGSTLKGAFLATANIIGLDSIGCLFGEVSSDGVGKMGALLVRGAIQDKAGNADGLPFSKSDGVFISAQTAINDGVGVADQNKLFFEEAIAPKAEFKIRLRLETRENIDVLKKQVLKLLGHWTAPDGIAIGADQASGLGRVKLDTSVILTEWIVSSDGALVSKIPSNFTLRPSIQTAATKTLKLECKGPYLSQDPSWNDAAREASNAEHPPNARALRHNLEPYLTGKSVSGALRSRQEWLEKIEALKNGKELSPPIEVLLDKTYASQLRPSERMFGLAGWRGVLRVRVSNTKRKNAHQSTSVKIDRFSGGPIDNALFSTDADYGVTTILELTFDGRETDNDKETLEKLAAEIETNGLQLGHGVNHGFGWFEVVS